MGSGLSWLEVWETATSRRIHNLTTARPTAVLVFTDEAGRKGAANG